MLTLPEWLNPPIIAEENQENNHDLSNPVDRDNRLIHAAFCFAYKLHEGQYRKSGEPYIAHPIEVAGLLRDLGGDSTMIAAGFLHDVVEDTQVTTEEIDHLFGSEVAQLVDGVTKLSKYNFSSKTERQAENFRRMFLAMAKDIRVIVVKLADRLHNMRTLEHLKPEKQYLIAQETREIFSPLANRLGIWRIKWELEDLAFKYLEPYAYKQISTLVSETRDERESMLIDVVGLLHLKLRDSGIHVFEVKGRPKHLYGIYQKMQLKGKEFHEIYDISAVRILVESVEECYRALAVVHNEYRPIPGRFKDYIAIPKMNRYQSLHTAIIAPNGKPLEVQIRTLQMHRIAEYGIAAHWKYKESKGSTLATKPQDEKFTWLRQLLEWQQELKDDQEYIDSLKGNLFEEDVYVFTPQGDVISLAKGSTPVDFAYRIHTEVGHHIKGVKVNGKWTVLDLKLQNGDIVEIITQKNCHPHLDWLNFVVTPGAKNKIRQWYKRSHREENMSRGKDLLEKELGKNGLDAWLKSKKMQSVAQRCNFQNIDDLYCALGYGDITVNQVVSRLREVLKQDQETQSMVTPPVENIAQIHPIKSSPSQSTRSSPIRGIEGLLYYIAGCCQPIPDESIIGVVTRGSKGIAIHRQGCRNITEIGGERLIPVSWNDRINEGRPTTYPVDISIEVIDRVGVLKDIIARVSDQNINIRKAGVKTHFGKPAIISLRIDVQDHQQLEHCLTQIQNMSDILNVRRVDNND